MSKVELKICPIMLRNIIGQIFSSIKCVFFFLLFCKNRILPAERRIILKNKKEKRKEETLDSFSNIERHFWTDVQLYNIYILICTYCKHTVRIEAGPKYCYPVFVRYPSRCRNGRFAA